MNNSVGDKLQYYRKRAGLSQLDLEVEMDASPGMISRIERGKVNPTKETLLKISAILNLNSIEVLQVLGIGNTASITKLLSLANSISSKTTIRDLIHASVNEVVSALNLYSAFITIKREDKLFALDASENVASKLTKQLLNIDVEKIHVSLSEHTDNLMVQCVNSKSVQASEDFGDFLIHAIDKNIIKAMKGFVDIKYMIAYPILFEERVLGAIAFGKKEGEIFDIEKSLLQEYTRSIGIALNNIKVPQLSEKNE